MEDKKTLAIILGAVVGVAAVASVGMYFSHHKGTQIEDVNEIFEQARKTVRKLDEAVETIKKSSAAEG